MAVELPLRRYYRFMFLPGLLLVVVPSVIHAYLLMPFPGAQDMEAIGAAYFLEKILPYSLIIGGLLVIGPILNKILNGTLRGKLGVIFLTVFLIGVTYMANVKWSAEKMFVEPKQKIFANAAENKVPLDYLVVGIEHKGSARAYPINYIGYHHKVQDSVGGMPVLVTYCTMCRTAMVFNPIIDGAYQTFRLVGARHYNAVLEDAGTGSWWYQATGEAAEGPKKGSKLEEIPYQQMTLKAWIERYPETLIMQPDPNYTDVYAQMASYDRGGMVMKDSAGVVARYSMLSWVVGVEMNGAAKAYDWADLLEQPVVNDVVGGAPLVVGLEKDSVDYHVWDRIVEGMTYDFTADSTGRGLRDKQTGSLWSWTGECVEGVNAGKQLETLPSSQMYWHAWKQFHPKTAQWKKKG